MNGADPDPVCLWSDRPYQPRGACGKRFCSAGCRAAFHRGCRLWAMRAFQEGLISIEDLRKAAQKPYTGFLGAKSPSEALR
jgi:hypothetical protein